MSKAEGEVTTGEADLLREIDEHYKRGNQPVEGDYNTQSLLWFSDGNQLLRRCRAMIEEQAREIAEDDMEITSLCNEADELRVVNASLRAKLDERERKVESLRAECGLRQIQGYWEGADRTLKAMRKYLTHDQTCPEYMNGTIAKCTCGLRDAIDAARQSAIEQSRNVEGSRMRIYCCRVYDKDHGEMLSWHSNRAEAELALGEGRRQSNSGDVTLCIIPTTRKGLIQWLNANFTTNNG